MNWPVSQDYNEAVQNPATSFSVTDLKTGKVVLNSLGLPVPRSGNFADVYEFKGGDGKKWALKCFTRKVAGLQERYAKIDEHLSKAQFPFTVGFKYMTEGIRIRGQWFPLLKMEWVEGFTLNEFIRDNADKKQYLHALMQMWGKLTALLRDGNFAHADLQHGNVLLVPATTGGKLGLRLIDYDGMWVPALAETHSGEVGHPNFQHPLRLKDRLYTADVDRFPHLVIAAALRATLLGGKQLWNKFDNGDNLLFKEGDLRDPANAPVFKTLWNLHDDVLCMLIGKIALASKEPLRKTPWLDDLLLTDEGKRLRDDEEAKVLDLLGVDPHFTAAKTAASPAAPAQGEFDVFAFAGDEAETTKNVAVTKSDKHKAMPATEEKKPKNKKDKEEKAKSKLPLYIGGGVAAVALVVGIIIAMSGGKKDKPTEPEVVKVDPKPPAPPPKKIDGGEPPKIIENPPKKIEEPPIVKKPGRPPLSLTHNNALTGVRHIPGTRGVLFTVLKNPDIIYIPNLDEDKVIVLGKHEGSARAVAVAPSGKLAISGGDDAKLRIWSLPTPGELFALKEHDKPIVACAVSPDGERAVTIGEDDQLIEWNIKTGTMIRKTAIPASLAVAYRPSGQEVLLGTRSESAQVWNLGSGTRSQTLPGHVGSVRAVGIAADGRAFTAGDDGFIRRWDLDNKKMATSTEKHDGFIGALAFAADDNVLVTGGEDKTLYFWNTSNLKQVGKLPVPKALRGIAPITEPGEFALALGLDGEGGAFRMAKIDLVGNKKDNEPKVGPTPTMAGIKEIWDVPSTGEMVAFSTDGAKIGTLADKMVEVHDAKNGSASAPWPMESRFNRFAFRSDGTIVVTSMFNLRHRLFAWDPVAKKSLFDIEDRSFSVGFRISEKAGRIFIPMGRRIGVFSLHDGSKLEEIEVPEYIHHVACSDDGSALLAGGSKGKTYFREDKSKPMRHIADLEQFGVYSAAPRLSPDGKRFVHFAGGQSILLYEAATGKQIAKLDGHTAMLDWEACAFSPDSKRLYSVADTTLRMWDLETAKEIAQAPLGEATDKRCVSVSPDGRLVAATFAIGKNVRRLKCWETSGSGSTAVAKKDPDPPAKVDPPVGGVQELKKLWQAPDRSAPSGVVAVSSDGTKAMMVSGGTLSIHDIKDGAKIDSVVVCQGSQTVLAACADGTLVVRKGSAPIEIFGWDPKAGKRTFTLESGSVAVSPKANLAFVKHSSMGLSVYSVADGRKIEDIESPSGNSHVINFACSADGQTLLTLTNGHIVHLRPSKGQPFKQLASIDFKGGSIPRLVLSADAKQYMQVGGDKPKIIIYDSSTGKQTAVFEGHPGRIKGAVFTPDGRFVVSIGDDAIRVWEAATGKEIRRAMSTTLASLALSPDGRTALTAANNNLIAWSIDTAVEPKVAKKEPNPPAKVEPKNDPASGEPVVKMALGWKISPGTGMSSVDFSEDGERVMAVRADGVRILSAKDGSLIEEIKINEDTIHTAKTGPDNLLFFKAKKLNQLTIAWDLAKKAKRFELPAAAVFRPAVNWKDGVVLIGKFDEVGIYSTKDGTKIETVKGAKGLFDVVCSTDGKVIVASATSGVCVKLAGDSEFKTVIPPPQGKAGRLALAPDSKSFAHSTGDEPIRICATDGGKVLQTLENGFPIAEFSFTVDGKRLIVVGRDTTVRLFDAETGKQLQSLSMNLGVKTALALSPDGRFALAGGTESLQMLVLEGANGPPMAKVEPKKEKKEPPITKVVPPPKDPIAWKEGFVKESKSVNFNSRGMALSLDGKKIYFGGDGHSFVVYDTFALTEIGRYRISGNVSVESVAVSQRALTKGGKPTEVVFVLDNDNNLRTWDPVKAAVVKEIALRDSVADARTNRFRVTSYPDSKTLVFMPNNSIKFFYWDLDAAKERTAPAPLDQHEAFGTKLRYLVYSSDGKLAVAYASREQLIVWNSATGEVIQTLKPSMLLDHVAISTDAGVVVGQEIERGRIVHGWDYKTGKQVWTHDPELGPTESIESITAIPHRSLFVIVSRRYLHFIDARDGTRVAKWDADEFSMRTVVSPSGRFVVTHSSISNRLKLWGVPGVDKKP